MAGASAVVVPGFLYGLAINATVTLGSVATAVQAASVVIANPTPNPAPSSPSAPSTSSASAIAPGFLDSPIFSITVTPGAFAPITTAQGATKASRDPAPVAQAPALPYASSSSTASASNTRQPGFIDSPPFSSTATLGSIRTTFNSGGATSSAGAASRSSSSRRTSSTRASGSGGFAPTSASSVEAGPFRSPSSSHTGAPSSSSSSSSSSGLAQISAQSASAISSTSSNSVGHTTPSIVVVPTPGSSIARGTAGPSPSSSSSASTAGTSTNHTDMVGLAIGLTCVLVLGVLATTVFVCRRFRSRRTRARGGAGLLLQGEDAMREDAYSPIARRRDSAGSARSRASIGSGMGMEVGAHYDTDTWAAPTAWSEQSGAGSRSQGPFYALREAPPNPFDFLPASPPPASPPARPHPVISAKGFMRRIRDGQASRGLMTTLAPVPESLSSPSPVPPQLMREISRPLPTHNEGGSSRPWIHRTRTISES